MSKISRLVPPRNVLLLGGVLVLGVAARYYGDRTYTSAANFDLRVPRDTNDAETLVVVCLAALAGSLIGALLGHRLNRVTAAIMGMVGGAVATAQYSSILGGVLGAPIGLLVAWLGPRRVMIVMLACVVSAGLGICGGAVAGAISPGPVEPVTLCAIVLLIIGATVGVNVFVARRLRGDSIASPWRRIAGRLALAMTTLSVAVGGMPLGVTLESLAWLHSIKSGHGTLLRPLDAATFTRGFCTITGWGPPSVFRASDLRKLRRFDGIITFRFYRADVGDDSLKLLGEWPKLQYLDLSETRVTDRGVRDLRGLRLLGDLNLNGTQVTGDCISQLPPTLGGLQLAGTAITDASLAKLAPLPLNWYLNLCDTAIGNSGVANLRGLRGLQFLYLSGTRITDAALATLAKNQKRLAHLELSGTAITSAGLAHLARLPVLEKLDLSDCAIDDDAIDELVRCKSLYVLKLTGTKITPAGIARLRKALPNCHVEGDAQIP